MSIATVKYDILQNLKDREYRESFALEHVYAALCSQVRTLREQRGWSQSCLGKHAKMAQERISVLEDPNAETKPTLNTIIRLASAYDVGLDVRFVPFSHVLRTSLESDGPVKSFEDEAEKLEDDLKMAIANEVQEEAARKQFATERKPPARLDTLGKAIVGVLSNVVSIQDIRNRKEEQSITRQDERRSSLASAAG